MIYNIFLLSVNETTQMYKVKVKARSLRCGTAWYTTACDTSIPFVPDVPLPIPAHGPEKAVEDGRSAQARAPMWEI